jgi:hypothetical protein
MPGIAAAPLFWGAIVGGGAAAAGQIVGAKMQSGAAKQSAQLQTASANYAADKQAQATREALDFQKAEAARARQDTEVTRKANYDQWAAQQRRLGTLGQLLGMAPPEIPGYVPLDGTLGSAMPSQNASPGAPAGAGTQSVPGGDYQAWFNSLVAGKPFNQQTLLDLEPELNRYGVKLTPPNAVGDRTKIGLPNGQWVRVGFGEGHPVWVPQSGTGSTVSARGTSPGTLGAMMPTPYAAAPMTPPLQAPPFQYPYGALGGYLGG